MPAATAKGVANTEAVRIEFAEAGIPGEVTTKVLKRYEYYLRWDPDTKLRPALQLWLKHLGSQQLSARLHKHPRLLCCTPEECNDIYMWLVSIGVDAEKIQQKAPLVLARQLSEVQSTVQAMQQTLQLTDAQLSAFFKRHLYSLLYSHERVARTLQTLAELLAVPVASKEMWEVVMVCDHRLFDPDPAEFHHRVSFFCKEFKGGQHATKAALKGSLYRMSVETMRARAAELKVTLGWTEGQLNQRVSRYPRILSFKSSTLAKNIQKLREHSFSSVQALDVYASFPGLAGYDWSSPSNVEKLDFLTQVLQLSTAELASKPQLLGTSFEQRLGPRSQFIYLSKGIAPDTPFGLSYYSSYIKPSDVVFAAKFNNLLANTPLIYDENFKQHWQQRWTFLRHEMGLSIADISACRALLFTSLPTLAPRWHFLTQAEAAQAGFKAADHLTALATLSDEHFAEKFNMVIVGPVYNKNLMQLV